MQTVQQRCSGFGPRLPLACTLSPVCCRGPLLPVARHQQQQRACSNSNSCAVSTSSSVAVARLPARFSVLARSSGARAISLVDQVEGSGGNDGDTAGPAPLSKLDESELPEGSVKPAALSSQGDAVCMPIVLQQLQEMPRRGIKVMPALQAVAFGLAIRFLVPIPAGVTEQGWCLLSIFSSTILGLILDPLPVGAWAFMAVTLCVVTKTLSFAQAFSAMTNEVIWLIVVSFFFAKGFEKTGLGERIANIFVRAMGKSTLGLAYGLNVAEAVLAPAMPSTSARAGGIFMPIIKSLSEASGSYPGNDSRKRMGAFLTHCQFQTGVHSGSIFLTASAQNLLCLDMAKELGAVVPDAFVQWMLGAALPSLVGLLVVPLVMYKLVPPEVKETPEAPIEAAARLEKMGPMSTDEKLMLVTMALAVTLWVVGPSIGVSAVLAAMISLCVLLCTGTLSWRDCLTYTPAWDTLTWFAVLIGMSAQLNSLGVIKAFADGVGGMLASLNMGWMPLFGLLHFAFFTIHYCFASQTAHVGALYSAFCAMMLAAGVPPVLAAMSLAYSINLFGSLTHYASGQAAAYYGSGFMRLSEVFTTGAINGYLALGLWAVLGMPVWKLLGWW